jgi:hypothetical protein
MATVRIPSPQKAKDYFEDKPAFTTGPLELERWVNIAAQVNSTGKAQAIVKLHDASKSRELDVPSKSFETLR